MWKCRGGWQKNGRKRGSEVKVMTDVMCPFSSATRHLPFASGVFICLFDTLPSPSTIWINVSLYAMCLIFFFPLCPLYMMCSCTSDVVSCVYISVRSYWSHFHQPLFPLYHCFPSFLAVYILFSLSVRLLFVIPSSLSFSFHTLLCTVFCQDLIYCQHCHSPEFAVSLCQHPPCSSTSFLGLPTTETGWYSGWAVQYCGVLHV